MRSATNRQQLPMDRSLHLWIVYYNCAVAVSQLLAYIQSCWIGFQLVGDVPLGVLAATVTIPSMLNGPVVNVTLVLVVVAAMLLNVSFVTANRYCIV
jgi:hypothetical protein